VNIPLQYLNYLVQSRSFNFSSSLKTLFIIKLNFTSFFVRGVRIFFLILLAGNSATWSQQTQVYKPNINRILFVLDGSGSMGEKWGDKTKFEKAKELLTKVIDSIERKNPNVEFAIRVFGYQFSREHRNCKDSKLIVPFGKNNAEKIGSALSVIDPKGMSPVAYSLQLGAKDFPDDLNSLNSLILITDGEENCEGNPCKISQELIAKRITLKPFIVGLNVDSTKYDTYRCMGTFYDTRDEAALNNTVGIIIRQTLNTTTAQINLLDRDGNPTISNIPFTLYDNYTGKIVYNFVHAMNEKGNPDTLYLDPIGIYDLELHTYPSVWKEGVELIPGKHNIIAVDVPAGDLQIECKGASIASNNAQVVLRFKDAEGILNVQDLNEQEKYLTNDYLLEILTIPKTYLDTTVAAFTLNKFSVLGQGTLSLMSQDKLLVSIYRLRNRLLELVEAFELDNKTDNRKLQPGDYWIVYKSKATYESESTKTQKFMIAEGRVSVIDLQ
jgi:Ca-activated chloride channel homolog